MLRAERQDARSEHRTARTLFEGDLLLSVNDETQQGALRFWNNDGNALAPSETGVPREVTIQSRIHSNDEQPALNPALRGFAKQAHNDFTFPPCTSWLQSAYGHVSVGRHECG